jgi:predicted nucleotidyltransferase
LFLFDSALTPDFKADSDVDFALTSHLKISPVEQSDSFFNLLDGLEKILHRKVDLISYRVVKNPIFKAELDKTKVSLYAAA